MNESSECGAAPLDSYSIQGFDFTSISPSQERHREGFGSHYIVTLTAMGLRCHVLYPPTPVHYSSLMETFHFVVFCLICRCLLLLLSFFYPFFSSQYVSTSSPKSVGRLFPQSGGDRPGSAAYISCQRWGLWVFPDQSEACLSSWSVLNLFTSAGGSADWFLAAGSWLGEKRHFSESQERKIKAPGKVIPWLPCK